VPFPQHQLEVELTHQPSCVEHFIGVALPRLIASANTARQRRSRVPPFSRSPPLRDLLLFAKYSFIAATMAVRMRQAQRWPMGSLQLRRYAGGFQPIATRLQCLLPRHRHASFQNSCGFTHPRPVVSKSVNKPSCPIARDAIGPHQARYLKLMRLTCLVPICGR
jgi:hypothetical protein